MIETCALKGKAMKMRNFDLRSSRVLGSGMIRGLLAVMVVAIAGCQPGLQPGETSHKLSVAWPIFDVEKSEGISADGVHWKKEKGDAAFCLSSWEKLQKFDKEDNLVYRKDARHSSLFMMQKWRTTHSLPKLGAASCSSPTSLMRRMPKVYCILPLPPRNDPTMTSSAARCSRAGRFNDAAANCLARS